MCLAPKMPPPPEAPASPPVSAIEGKTPTTVKPSTTKRESMQQASKGAAALTIPLSTGGMSTGAPNLSIGSLKA